MTQPDQKIRNIRAFVGAYLNSESGIKALNRKPVRVGRGKEATLEWHSPVMAHAFKEAING